jgi:hypothetical protein
VKKSLRLALAGILLAGLFTSLVPAAAQTRPLYLTTNYEFAVYPDGYPINRCNDNADNDGDGWEDDADPDCNSEAICDDSVDNDGDLRVDGFAAGVTVYLPNGTSFLNLGPDSDCLCMSAATGFDGCTANDVETAYSVTPLAFDGCINQTDTAEVQLTASLAARGGNQRYDVGMWLAQEGQDALFGARCVRTILSPTSATATPLDPAGDGPFEQLEGLYNDACGDISNLQNGNNTITDATFAWTHSVKIPCRDNIASVSNGFVDVGQCGSWDNNVNNPANCFSLGAVAPNNNSKCNCSEANTGLPGPDIYGSCQQPPTQTNLPGGNPALLEPGETVTFRFEMTNTVPGCDPTLGTPNTWGTNLCGTAGFFAYLVDYSAASGLVGSWGGLSFDSYGGVVYADGLNSRFLAVPRNHLSPFSLGVMSPNWDTVAPIDPRYFEISFTLGLNPAGANINLPVTTLWSQFPIDTNGDGFIDEPEYQGFLSSARVQNCTTGCSCNFQFSTTPVTLTTFRATPARGGFVDFEWTTASEVNHVGFHLYAQTPGGRVQINDELITGEGADQFEEQEYSVRLAVPDDATAFYIEDVDIFGQARPHGPYRLDESFGERLVKEAIDWRRVQSASSHQRRLRERAEARRGVERVEAAASVRAASPLGLGEVLVAADGIQRIDHAALVAAGVDLTGIDTRKLALFAADGTLVPLRVGGGKTFGSGSFLEFVGSAVDTLYTGTNVYRLKAVSKGALAAVTDTTSPTGTPASYHMAKFEFERNRDYHYASSIEDPFFDTRIVATTAPVSRTFTFTLSGYLAGAATARLNVRFYGASSVDHAPDHHVVVSLNGTVVGESLFDGLTSPPFDIEIPPGLLIAGANTLVLRLPADTGAPVDVVNLDSFTVTYPQSFAASGDRLSFSGSGQRFEIPGFTSPDLVAYRVSGGIVTRLAGLTVSPTGGSYVASLPGTATESRYFVAASSALYAPSGRIPRAAVNLLDGVADVVVISHPDFLDGLTDWLGTRAEQGFTVKVVDIEDVYAQYSGGVVDALALQRYLARAATTLGARFALLVGGDSYDYRNYLGLGAVSFVPSIYTKAGAVWYTPSDAAIVDFDGDGVPNMAIGRLPVRTANELENAISKILLFESKDYGRTALFAADADDPRASIPFRSASEMLVSLLGPSWQAGRAYISDLGISAARIAVSAAFNDGRALINFVGHSGSTNWGDPSRPGSGNLLSTADVALFTNYGRPAMVVQWGCWNTYYVSPRTESLGNRLMLVGENGAVAVMGATTLTEDANENALARHLVPRLASPGATIGEAILAAKQRLAAENSPQRDLSDVLLGWNLLGDPTMVLEP